MSAFAPLVGAKRTSTGDRRTLVDLSVHPLSRRGFAIALLAKASDYFVFPAEITMQKLSLSEMTVEALMDLRKRVDETLHQHRAKLQQQWERMEVGGARVGGGGGSALKGKKVPPKYRGPSGETWAG